MSRTTSFRPLHALLPGLFALGVIGVSGSTLGLASSTHSEEVQRWLRSWIPAGCCVTNRCCFEIASTDVRPLPGDRWLILASGQTIGRTGWSPDGKYWRCACDNVEGKWIVHPAAFTRCLYVPFLNS